MSIRLKVLLVTLVLFLLGGAALLYTVDRGYAETLDASMHQTVTDSQSQFVQLQQRDVDKLDAALGVILTRDDIVAAFKARDREALYALCQPIYAQLHERNDITTFVFFESPPDSTYFLRVQLPEQFGDKIARPSYLQAVENGDLGYGLDLGKHLVALRAVRPVEDEDGTIIGYLELGMEVPTYLTVLKEQTGDEFALVLTKDIVKQEDWIAMRARTNDANDWADNDQWVVAGSSGPAIDASSRNLEMGVADIPTTGDVLDTFQADGKTLARGVFPVLDATGATVGAILLEHDMTDMAASLASAKQLIMTVLAAMIVILLAVLLVMLNSLVFKRLDTMVANLEETSLRFMGGDLSVKVGQSANDEIGKFESFFGKFLSTIAETLKAMSAK